MFLPPPSTYALCVSFVIPWPLQLHVRANLRWVVIKGANISRNDMPGFWQYSRAHNIPHTSASHSAHPPIKHDRKTNQTSQNRIFIPTRLTVGGNEGKALYHVRVPQPKRAMDYFVARQTETQSCGVLAAQNRNRLHLATSNCDETRRDASLPSTSHGNGNTTASEHNSLGTDLIFCDGRRTKK